MNFNPLAYKATMFFECQTDFGRWVKFGCITMSLFIVMYLYMHFSCNITRTSNFRTNLHFPQVLMRKSLAEYWDNISASCGKYDEKDLKNERC